MYIYVCVHGAYGHQKRVSETLELEMQVVMSCLTWVLGTNLGPLKEQDVIIGPAL